MHYNTTIEQYNIWQLQNNKATLTISGFEMSKCYGGRAWLQYRVFGDVWLSAVAAVK